MGKNIRFIIKCSLLVMVLLSVFSNHIWGRTGGSPEEQSREAGRLLAVFSATGVSFQSYRLNQLGELKAVDTPSQMLKEAQVWSRSLGLPVVDRLRKEDGRQVYVSEGAWDGGARVALMMTTVPAGKATEKIYYNIQVEGNDESRLEQNYARLAYHFSQYAILPQINISIQGRVDGILNWTEQNGMIRQVMEQLAGKEIERLDDERLVSVSGYSRLLHRAVKSNHQAINLQVAVHTNEGDKRTAITIGTPIINVEY